MLFLDLCKTFDSGRDEANITKGDSSGDGQKTQREDV